MDNFIEIEKFIKTHNLTENQFFGIDKIYCNLYLSGLTSIPKGFNPTVGRNLYLSGLTSIPKGFNPTVGRNLYLNNLTSIPKEFNPTVGGNLYLSGLTSIPKGFNPTIGGDLYLNNLTSKYCKLGNKLIEWQNGKYVKVDKIFTEVLNKKGNVRKVKQIGSTKEFYLINDNNGNYSHGDTLKEAKEDLIYKITNRNKETYLKYTLETILTFAESIEAYRVITGACSFGTKDFVNSNNIKNKSYSIQEIITLTKEKYGHDKFSAFFNVK